MRLPAAIHAASFLVAMCAQTIATPLAGVWVFFHFIACSLCRPDVQKNQVWYWTAAWLLALGCSTFLFSPVVNGTASMWILAAGPMLALSVRQEHLKHYLDAFFAVLVLYACGLIFQMMGGIRYTHYEYFIDFRNSYATCWPLLDPNNAALLINCGLIPSFYMSFKRPKWLVPFVIFVAALFATASKGGALAAFISCTIILFDQMGEFSLYPVAVFTLLSAPYTLPALERSFSDRLVIWKAALPLAFIHPWRGLGLGLFSFYYNQVRTEKITGGWFAHNDLLQFAVEMGIPAMLIFCGLIVAVARTTHRKNLVSACVLLAIFLQSLVEFQFYVPAVSLLFGLALAHHQLTERVKDPITVRKSSGFLADLWAST